MTTRSKNHKDQDKNKISMDKNKISMDKVSFPTLKETLTSTGTKPKPKSFASVAKKMEEKVVVKPYVSDVKPGWIHIRKNKGKIEFKYNRTDRNTVTEEDIINEEKRFSHYLFMRRVTLQQWDRDIQNEMLGDLSPYWNTKTILEMHEEDDYQEGDYEEDYTKPSHQSADDSD